VRRALREEAEAWRGRRAGLLGYSEEELEEALRSLEEVEAELLADWEVLVPREEEVEGVQEEGLLCPICKTGLLAEDSACQVQCQRRGCGLLLGCLGGLGGLAAQLEAAVGGHAASCAHTLMFSRGPECILACCDPCQFLSALGGL